MKLPLVACLLLPGILVHYGLHIVQRQIILVDLALAQVAAVGTCLSVLLGYDVHEWQSYVWSLAFTIVGAAIFTLTRDPEPRSAAGSAHRHRLRCRGGHRGPDAQPERGWR